jgi:hypothetical protein
LESYACYEVGHQVIPATGTIRLFGRDAYLDAALGGVRGTFCESLEGLEARLNGRCVAVLREYRTFKQMTCYRGHQLPPALYFEPYTPAICPRIAVA